MSMVVKWNGNNGFGKRRSPKLMKVYQTTLQKPKRFIQVGVDKDGALRIQTRLFKKNEVVQSEIQYSKECVGFILSAIFSGYNEWNIKPEGSL